VDAKTTPKLCECGCGEPAPISPVTDAGPGYVQGQPRRFVNGHQNRGRAFQSYIPIYKRFRIEERGHPTPCWTWILSLEGHGYGQMWDRSVRRTRRAHRVFYEMFVGSIPQGLHLDHLCSNRDCVNPQHLEPVTLAENNRRAWARIKQMRRSSLDAETDTSLHS
jgi:hypothetical protein